MRSLALIIPKDYKLLSIAAILDVFETVNRLYAEQNKPLPFSINVLQAGEQLSDGGAIFHGYKIKSIDEEVRYDLVLIPAFSTDSMSDTLSKNQLYIPWLQNQYKEGAEIASFCTGAFFVWRYGLAQWKTSHNTCGCL
ncbi:MAG TPA: hypothetical protein VHO72_03515 [Bacteroidales bacterium]|nr:hypothetical protein [Bacteroidales bacterium]